MQAWWLFNTDKVQQTPFSHTFCSLALTGRARGKLFVDATSAGTNLASWLNTNRLCESCFTQGAQRAPQSCHATLSRSKPNMEVFLGSGRWPSFPQSHKTESSRHKRNQFIHATNRTTSVFQSYDLKIKNGGKRRKCKYPAYLYVLTHRLSIGLDWSSVTALSCLIPTYLFSFMMQVSRTSSRALNLFWPAKKKKKRRGAAGKPIIAVRIPSAFCFCCCLPRRICPPGQVGDDGSEENWEDITSFQSKRGSTAVNGSTEMIQALSGEADGYILQE